MGKGDYFIDFIYHDQALKGQERNKFILEKSKEDAVNIRDLKLERVREADNFLGILASLELELKEFKKLLPTESAVAELEKAEGINEKPQVKHVVKPVVHKKSVKKIVKKPSVKREVKKPVKNINELRLGLQKIRDELSKM